MHYLVAVDDFFPDRPGGSARVAWDIAQVMRDRGHQVTVFCRKQKPDDETSSEYEGVKVVRFVFPKTLSLDPLKVYKQKMAGITTARKYLVNTDWDLIHIHLPLQGKIVYDVLGDRPRYVYTVHSPFVTEQEVVWSGQALAGKIKLLLGKGMLRRLEGRQLRRVNDIHTLSTFTKKAIDNYYGVGDKVVVIPHWCREDFYRQFSKTDARAKLDWPQDAKILFTVRRLATRMGLDIAIKALTALLKTQSELYFAIAGTGALEKPLKQLTQSLGLTSKVWFLGHVSDDTLKRCYEAADLFILPTRALECFGLPVLEALVYGLPIISTDAAAIPELMQPILPQCIVPAGSVEKLREKIQAYLENKLELPAPEELTEYVKKHYGRDVILPKLMELLECT